MWRIATDAPAYTADDLSGAGAKTTGGRWNSQGVPMLYCAQSIALACLETVVHLKASGLPFNRYLVKIDIPDAAWVAATSISATSAPIGWDAVPASKTSIDFGNKWAAGNASLLLAVPSVIVPEEYCILINPLHPDIKSLGATKVRKFTYDPRIGGGAP